MNLRKKVTTVFGAAAAASVIAGAAAFACTNLATLNLSTSMGKPGDAVTVTGTGFMASVDEMPMDGMVMEMGPGGTSMMGTTAGLSARSPVILRWNGPDGPVLSDAIPDKSGTISVLFNIPEAQPGHYTVVAVQKNAQGFDVYGTPARAAIQVVGPGQSGAGVRGAGPEGAGQSTSTGAIALTVGLGVLGLGLLGAGGLAATRVVRVRRGVPATVDGEQD